MEFDPDLVIPDKTKSILDGAIVPWSGRFSSYRKQELSEEIQIQFDDTNKSNEVKADQSNFVWY